MWVVRELETVVIRENQSNGFCTEDKKERNDRQSLDDEAGSTSEVPVASVPPPNALLLMRCRISSDIAKETWVVGGMKDAISRSRSWKG
ncbi:uncharacterized protein Pyn_34954 [Prunus yedoensis var. nudiflora]|uniref:Uncharacterized protein n=1 Tax=Prunus yedoensis var. nudiflora TaxID=2094558 RepID=A0A314V0Y4_PRUYE|nr:uncharacterized protein Pyn_34954 [Prunus yedoensis var. nudiflora]